MSVVVVCGVWRGGRKRRRGAERREGGRREAKGRWEEGAVSRDAEAGRVQGCGGGEGRGRRGRCRAAGVVAVVAGAMHGGEGCCGGCLPLFVYHSADFRTPA